jgi:predicted alpha/beta superfamily hydrolase
MRNLIERGALRSESKGAALAVLLCVLLFACNKNSEQTQRSNQIVIGAVDSLFSKTLNEQRKVWVHVPNDPTRSKTKTKYPVLYLLDGDDHFYSVVGLIQQLSNSQLCPNMIVVGIPNTDRIRDLTPTPVKTSATSGGGENFAKFISDELIPYIDSHYPTTSYRTLIGHSLGGLTSINTLMHHRDIFANYLAIDPSMWWDGRKLLKESIALLDEKKFDHKFLYVAIANTMPGGMSIKEVVKDTSENTEHIRSILQFVETAKNKSNSGLQFESKYYPDDTHGSVPLIAEYDALRAMFPWYKFTGIYKFYDSNSKATVDDVMKELRSHYAVLSDHFGYAVTPEENMINNAGYGFLGQNMNDKAFAMFDMNIKNYPDSPNVYDSMGDYYLSQKDTVKAIELFNKALSMADLIYTKEKLKKIKEKVRQN